MYQNILVPLDGSQVASSVLPYVANLAKRLESRVTLLTVFTLPQREARGLETEVRAEAQAVARREAQRLAEAGVAADTLVVSGRPAEQIVNQAQTRNFDLIAMGTRGQSGIRRGLVGSVTDEVVRSSKVPVLVLSPLAIERSAQSDYGLSSITVPLDGSELAEYALPYAEELAKRLSLEISLLRVVQVASLAYYAGDGVPMNTLPLEEELEAEAIAYLDKVADDVRARGLTTSQIVLRGSPALSIVDHVKNLENNLVAICTHGRSGLGRLLIGSVADSIIRSSGVPVLAINPQAAPSR
jgi:nucleotide-binding universal stress UspA family protein